MISSVVWVIVIDYQKRHVNAHVFDSFNTAEEARAALESYPRCTIQVRKILPTGLYHVDIEATLAER